MHRVIYDIEVYKNYFLICLEYEDGDKHSFEIFPRNNEAANALQLMHLRALFLSLEDAQMIGFNNIAYDYQVLHPLIHSLYNYNGTAESDQKILDINYELYHHSQEVINTSKINWNMMIDQIDLFRIWHFNNKARTVSLKQLEAVFRMQNIKDLPYPWDEEIDYNNREEIIQYCFHDVEATKRLYRRSKTKIELRKIISEEYDTDMINYSDSKIGETIMLLEMSKRLNLQSWRLKQTQTERAYIDLDECIADNISFNTREFSYLLETLKNKRIVETKGSLEYTVNYAGIPFKFGLGGLHACISSGIYKEGDEYMIVDVDVASYYPNIAIKNGYYPEHLSEAFCEIYDQLYQRRLYHKKLRKTHPKSEIIQQGLKLSLNSIYGKSNDKYSFLLDPKYTMSVTLTGQLSLAMLCEAVYESPEIHDCTILQVNTDGVTFKIRRSDYDHLKLICKAWEEQTQYELEFVEYSKMVIRDVNNYISVTTDGYVKEKGAFETSPDIHKNHSMLVVAKAVGEYFVNGTDFREYINNERDDYEFMKIFRTRSNWNCVEYSSQGRKVLSKTVRYVVTKDNTRIMKEHEDGRTAFLEANWATKNCNNYVGNLNINRTYYIKEAEKLIHSIESIGQQSLF